MIKFIFLLAIVTLAFIGCEDVVDVDLKDDQPKLVVEALISWEKGTLGNEQTISLRETSSFFDQKIVNAIGATVVIAHEDGTVFPFVETTPGEYSTDTFVPEIGASYTLTIEYKNETYQASETMIGVSILKKIEQDILEIGGEEIPILSLFYDDPINEENFYLVNVIPDFQPKKSIDFFTDEFINGNEIKDNYSSDFEDPENDDEIREYQEGDVFDIKLFGISKRFYNYFSILFDQSDANAGPFSIAPAAAKGNCINLTNKENFPFGYFRLSEMDRATYIYE